MRQRLMRAASALARGPVPLVDPLLALDEIPLPDASS